MNSHSPLKKKPKKLNNPDPRPGRLGKAIRHLLRLTGFALILILLLTLFYLLTLGIPGPLTRHITAGFQKKGVPLHIESISLSPHRGWVLHNACLYSHSPDDLEPILQADKFYLKAWPEHWTALFRSDWNISLYSKQVHISLGPPWEASLSNDHPFRTLNKVRGRLHVDPTGISLSSAELLWGGCTLRAAGQVAAPNKPTHPPTPARPSGPASIGIQARATQVAEVLAGLTFETPPEINLRFNVPASGIDQTTLDVTFFAAGLQRQGQVYNQISGALNLYNRRLTLNALQITQPGGDHLNAFGFFDLESQLARLDIDNSLPADALLTLMPESTANGLTRAGLTLFGAVDFDVVLGPDSPEQLLQTIHANIRELQVIRNDLTLDPIRLTLVRDGNQLVLSDIQAQANGNPLAGKFEIDLASHAWETSLQGSVLPDPIGTLTGGGFQKFIKRFSFPGPPPTVQVDLSHTGTKGSLQILGTLSGTHFLCAEIPIDSLETSVAYSNRVLVLNGLRATQNEKHFAGDVQVNFKQKLATFDATSSFDPPSIAQAIAPQHPTFLTNFTFAGPIESKGRGQVDYSGGTHHAFSGTFMAKDVSVGKLKSDLFSSQIEGRNDQLIFTQTSIQLLDGVAEGSATFDLQFKNSSAPYSIDLHATQMDLQQLLSTFSTTDSGRTTGRLSGTFKFDADAKSGFWKSAGGGGAVEIEKGQLKDLPILGGFSRLIRTTLPGFSLFSMTTLYSEYELRDGALKSDNLQLGGTFLSAQARGQYSPEKGLDFIVQAEPLRQTRDDKEWYQLHLWGADVIKQGTAPLFRLLEFKLKGNLNAPEWRLINLPKELSDLLKVPGSISYGPRKEKQKKSPQ